MRWTTWGVVAIVAFAGACSSAPQVASPAATATPALSAPASERATALDQPTAEVEPRPELSEWSPAESLIGGEALPGLFWTGSEVIVLRTSNGGREVVGERWDPTTNSATTIAPSGLSWRVGPAMVWTGEEVLIAGGSSGPALNQIGAAYNPVTDMWRQLADPPGEVDAWQNLLRGPAIWTGTEMIAWASELAYSPASDSWRSIAAFPKSTPWVARPVTVFTGDRIIVWGGCYVEGNQCDEINEGLLATGSLYDIATDTWTALPESPLTPAVHMVAGWTGSEVLIVVTDPGDLPGERAAAFNPATMQWRVLTSIPLSPRRHAAAVFTDGEFVVWGGGPDVTCRGQLDGATYDPVTDLWSILNDSPGPGRCLHSMIDAGGRIYISATLRARPPLQLVLGD